VIAIPENVFMDIEEFWKLIDTTREATGGDVSKQVGLLVEILVNRSIDEIFAYEKIMDDLLDKAYDAALWDAADIIGCGTGDDGFMDFRAWLIAQGQEVYESALADPESLVDLVDIDDDAQEEEMLFVAMYAYEKKTGNEMPIRRVAQIRPRPKLKGKSWPRENRNERFPKLDAKFGDCKERWRKWLTEDFPNQT
jgi:Protein of unknown function (DUF4240)